MRYFLPGIPAKQSIHICLAQRRQAAKKINASRTTAGMQEVEQRMEQLPRDAEFAEIRRELHVLSAFRLAADGQPQHDVIDGFAKEFVVQEGAWH
jgi:hypothetical protein